MTAAAVAPSTSFELVTTSYTHKKANEVTLENGSIFQVFTNGVQCELCIQQHHPANAVPSKENFQRIYMHIPSMPAVLCKLIADYLPVTVPPSASLRAVLADEYPGASSITQPAITAVMAILPPSDDTCDVILRYTASPSAPYAVSYQPVTQTSVLASKDTLSANTVSFRPNTSRDLRFLSSPALQQHPLGGNINHLIVPYTNNGTVEKEKACELRVMLYQPPKMVMPTTDQFYSEVMKARFEKNTNFSAVMDEMHNKQQTAVVKEVD